MAPPLPTVNVQGIGAVGADNLNTYVQTVKNFAQLRTFSAINDMCVMALGGASEGDGSQGLFWYDATSTAADNNTTVIVPTGNLQGAWLLLPPGSNSPGNFASLTVSGNGSFGGNLTVGGTLGVTGVATFAADLLMTGTGEIEIPAGTTGQRSASPVAGMIRYNTTLAQFEGYGASWSPLAGTGVAFPPGGRLTLTSGVPVLVATVTAAIGLIYTPSNAGNTVPQWNGSAWSSTTFAEISQALSDTVNSPAAAVANTIYDVFVWFKSGVATLSRGAASGSSVSRVQGFLANTLAITNGPAAGYGLWVGRIATDVSAASVTFAPNPAAASGGPTTGSGGGNPGAWIGLWNVFNRVPVNATAADSKASWSPSVANTWQPMDGSNNNRVSYVVGNAEDAQSFVANVMINSGAGGDGVGIGIGLNSTSAVSGVAGLLGDSTGSFYVSQTGFTSTIAAAGLNYAQALQQGATTSNVLSGAATQANGALSAANTAGITAQLRY